jgi:UDP-glucose 4-epimerase
MANKIVVIGVSIVISVFLVSLHLLLAERKSPAIQHKGGYNILVTGAAGFIGSHLVQHFEEDEADCEKIFVLDDLTTGKKKNIAKFQKVELVIGSIGDKTLLEYYMAKDIKYVFHFAAKTSIPDSYNVPYDYLQVNSMYTIGLLDLAQKYKVSRFIFASSSVVYGPDPHTPTKEDDPLNPTSPYAKSKEISEWFILNSPIDGIILRFFNVYGEKQVLSTSILAKFVSNALKDRDLTIFGDGLQTRDYVYVKDVVDATVFAVKSAPKGIYNVGSERNMTAIDVAKHVLEATHSHSKIVFVPFGPKRREVVRTSLASTEKLRSLGWTPKHRFEEGLANTIQWIQRKRKI